VLVPPFDDELIMAGQATGAVELLEDVPDLDAVVVPVSGGGLLGGWATAARKLRPSIAIYGAEPENASDTKQSLAAGHRIEVKENPTIADGLRVTSPGKLTFPIVQQSVHDVLLVSDAEMIETLTWILERMKVLVEPSGSAAAAAVRHRKADFAGRRVGVVLSGGNVDLARLSEYIAARNRL
jgi:threonine dehydratase